MRYLPRHMCGPFLLLGLCPSLLCAEEAAELARHLPTAVNTVAVVRVSEIFGSERARTEGWAKSHEERFLNGTAVIPAWVETLVVGSLVHPAVPEEVWSTAVMRLPKSVSIESIAEHEGTQVEELAGVPAVRSRRDSYLVQPLPGLLAAHRPAHRLETSRWIRSITDDQPGVISPYLRDAVSTAGHLVLAMDLRDLLDAERVEQLVRQDERFASHQQLVDRLVPLLTGLRGVTFSATIAESNQATVTIDFSADVGPSSLTVKTLLVSILDDLGASISEFADAKVSSQGPTVTLGCRLSDESLRRILSLIVTPSTPYQVPQQATSETAKKTAERSSRIADPADATRNYVEAVNEMIDDLRRANQRAKNYQRTAAWHDNFARRILELPTAGVSREALSYGQSIASKFRALGASLRGQGIEVNAQQKTLTYDVDYKPGWFAVNVWGGVGYREPSYNVSSNLQEVREKQAAAVTAGAKEREQIWQFIDDERAAISHTLVDTSGVGRIPANDAELKYWLQNMVAAHRFSVPEVALATGMSEEKISAALKRFGISSTTQFAPPADRLFVLPYPGGRHPRLGFLDGAVNPQRETKVSVFTPWHDPAGEQADYVVIDAPEAIRSNLGLAYLAHTHVPTIWTEQGIEMERLEWQRHDDGSLTHRRQLPNGIAFTSAVHPRADHVRMRMTFTNGTDETLTGLRVQMCVMLKGADGFAQQTRENKVLQDPYAAVHDPSGQRWILTAWKPNDRTWANPRCPCLHSDPRFPDCAPGEIKTIDGWLSFYEGGDITSEFARIEATKWWTDNP